MDNLITIGIIENHWSWEYDSSTITAILYLKPCGFLILDVNRKHIKSGLGKGVFENHIGTYDVGTLKKPLKRMINTILKDNKQTYPFQKLGWYTDKENGLSLNKMILDTINGNNNISRSLKLSEIKKKIKDGK